MDLECADKPYVYLIWKGSELMRINPKSLIGEATEYDKKHSVERK